MNTKINPATEKKFQQGFGHIILIIIVAAVLAVGGYFAYQRMVPAKVFNPAKPPSAPAVAISQRSKAPGIITQITMAKTIDPNTSKAIVVASKITATDPAVYAVLTLNKAPVGTKIEYIRYYSKDGSNFKPLDHKSLTIAKVNAQYAAFNWNLTGNAKRVPGSYLIKTYTNGRFERAVTYTVSI